MGPEYKGSESVNHCVWCGCTTNREKMLLPATPILEFIEVKIDIMGREDVWGENSNWAILDLDSDAEAELLVYDELLNTITMKSVCRRCLEEDDRLWDKYYGGMSDGYIDYEIEF